jgi:hypothetical protein
MKITHIDGTQVDTDILPDTEAMVLEKVEEFRKFCLENKVPFLMFINPQGLEETNYISFWSFANRVNNYEGDGKTAVTVNINPILSVMNSFITRSTNGSYFIAANREE